LKIVCRRYCAAGEKIIGFPALPSLPTSAACFALVVSCDSDGPILSKKLFEYTPATSLYLLQIFADDRRATFGDRLPQGEARFAGQDSSDLHSRAISICCGRGDANQRSSIPPRFGRTLKDHPDAA